MSGQYQVINHNHSKLYCERLLFESTQLVSHTVIVFQKLFLADFQEDTVFLMAMQCEEPGKKIQITEPRLPKGLQYEQFA